MTAPPQPPSPYRPRGHRLFGSIVTVFGVIAAAAIIAGVRLCYLGLVDGLAEVTFLGRTLSPANAGIIAIVLGAIVLYATSRVFVKALGALEKK